MKVNLFNNKVIALFAYFLLLMSCNKKENKILNKVLPNYDDFNHKKEFFSSNMYVSPLIIIYKAKMDSIDYSLIIQNPKYISNCNEFSGLLYENMKENAYPFELSEVSWWRAVYNKKPDFVGHYSLKADNFTNCNESREYKFAYKYLNGYCYLIIENTLQ